jgi:hypothetical protein
MFVSFPCYHLLLPALALECKCVQGYLKVWEGLAKNLGLYGLSAEVWFENTGELVKDGDDFEHTPAPNIHLVLWHQSLPLQNTDLSSDPGLGV